MRLRRRLLVALGAVAIAAPATSLAQQARGRTRTIGWLEAGTPESFPARRSAFLQVLRGAGLVEGQNLVVHYRYAHGKLEQFPALATELIGLKPECLVAMGIDAIRALRKLTSTIPIVMGTIDADPVKEGLVASMARPGGNITGMIGISWELAGKRLELLKEIVPNLARVAIVFDPRSPAGAAHMTETQAAARTLGLALDLLEVQAPADLDRVFRTARTVRTDAFVVVGVGMVNSHRPRIVALAAEARLPAIYSNLDFVADGGLIAYAPNLVEQTRGAAIYVEKILQGGLAGELPIQQPTKFELFINMKSARSINLSIPRALLARADRVIE